MIHDAFFWLRSIWFQIRSWLDSMQILDTPFTMWHVFLFSFICSVFFVIYKIFLGGK